MLARRQCLEVRGLQVHHGGALFSGVVGLGKGLAVHLDTLEGAERRGGTEHQAVIAAGIIRGGLVGAVQLSGDAGGGGIVIVAAGGLGGDGVGLILFHLVPVDCYFAAGTICHFGIIGQAGDGCALHHGDVLGFLGSLHDGVTADMEFGTLPSASGGNRRCLLGKILHVAGKSTST